MTAKPSHNCPHCGADLTKWVVTKSAATLGRMKGRKLTKEQASATAKARWDAEKK
jgi:hypothetical protein